MASKCKALSSNPSTTKINNLKKKELSGGRIGERAQTVYTHVSKCKVIKKISIKI
jgi:hypothetical protein